MTTTSSTATNLVPGNEFFVGDGLTPHLAYEVNRAWTDGGRKRVIIDTPYSTLSLAPGQTVRIVKPGH